MKEYSKITNSNWIIYYQDQYKKETDAKVVKVEGNRILLDKTIFIPQTNTELGNFGKIQDVKIAGSKKEGGDVWHIILQYNLFHVKNTSEIGEIIFASKEAEKITIIVK